MKNVTPGYERSEPPPVQIRGDAERRLQRLRRVAWTLDRLLPVGQQRRIGIDPLIGLIPVVGDWVAAGLSVYVLYEAARLGLPWAVLGRIALNIVIEGVVGAVPVAGDIFDFVFQANMRNLRLVEGAYHPGLRPRSFGKIWLGLALFTAGLIALLGLAIYALVSFIAALFS